MNKALLIVPLLAASLAVAATSRIITIEGGRQTGNPRTGPYDFTGDFTATVQDLKIKAPHALLEAPDGTQMSQAQGKRTASFDGGVTVTRGRLTANGPSLVYKETTGIGTLKGPTKAVQKPSKAGDDDVVITGDVAEFDVDTDTSTSKGNVRFVNGPQSGNADKVVFEENRELAVMTDANHVTLVREPRKSDEKRLTINANEARILTGKKILVATGKITLVSGDNTTTGDSLYYDDAKNIAYITGRPAVNTRKNGDRLSGSTIVNNTKSGQVRVGAAYKFNPADFKLTTEK